jgi:hypothetical protein
LLTPRRLVGDGLGDGEAVVADIEAAAVSFGWLSPVGEEGFRGAGSWCRRHVRRAKMRGGRGMFSGDGERRMAGNGVAANLRCGGACGGEEEGVRARESAKGQPHRLLGRIYRVRRGRGATAGGYGHQCHGGRRLQDIQEEGS